MTEIRKTLAILKARWPEVILIISIHILSTLLSYTSKPINLFSIKALVFLAFAIILMTLRFGFMRTFYLEGQQKQSPLVLLKTGKHFIWRMIRFGLIYIPICWILAWLTFLAIKRFAAIETGFWEAAKVAPLVYRLCFTTAMLILIKPLLFIPALIIALDCKVFKSFKLLRRCKLSSAKELVILFFISMTVTFFCAFLPSTQDIPTISWYISAISLSIVGNFISLMVGITAIRFVVSLNLVHDSQLAPHDFEDSRKYTN